MQSDWLSYFDWQAWDVVLQQTNNLLQHIKENAQKMESETITKLGDLINKKKEAKRYYSDERTRLETEFNKVWRPSFWSKSVNQWKLFLTLKIECSAISTWFFCWQIQDDFFKSVNEWMNVIYIEFWIYGHLYI